LITSPALTITCCSWFNIIAKDEAIEKTAKKQQKNTETIPNQQCLQKIWNYHWRF